MKTKKNKIKYNKNNKKTQKGGNISININEHIDKSFKELNIILDKTKLNVRFPNLEAFKKDNKLLFRQLTNKNELTNLGKGLAITQWPQNNSNKGHEKMINLIQTLLTDLHTKYPNRVEFGNIAKNKKDSNVIRVFGANATNWNLNKSTKITGGGQANVIGVQDYDVFGIVTTPKDGINNILDDRKSINDIFTHTGNAIPVDLSQLAKSNVQAQAPAQAPTQAPAQGPEPAQAPAKSNSSTKKNNKTKQLFGKSDFSGACDLYNLTKEKNMLRGQALVFSKSSLLTRFNSLDLFESQHKEFKVFLQKFTVDFCINHGGDRKYIALCFNIIDCVKNPDSFLELAKNIYNINLTKNDENELITELKLEKSNNSKKAINEHIIKINSTHLSKFIVYVFKKAFNAYDKKNINKFPNGRSNKLKVKRGLKKLLLKINIDAKTIQKIFSSETPEKESEKIIIAKVSDPYWKQQLGKNSDKEIDAAIKKEEQHEEKLKQQSLSGNFDDENRTPSYLFYVGIMGLLAFMANSDLFTAPPTFTRV